MRAREAAQLRADVTDVFNSYAYALDAKDRAALGELLAPDVVLVRASGTYHGVEEFLNQYESAIGRDSPRSRHFITNIDPRIEDEVIRVRAYFLATFDEGAAIRLVWGHYNDTLVERDGRLMFQEKVNVIERTVRIEQPANA